MDRRTENVQHVGMGRCVVSGTFFPNGAGAPTGTGPNNTATGPGYSVARTAVGTYVVTLLDAYVRLSSKELDLAQATLSAQRAQFGPINVSAPLATNRSAVIFTGDGAAVPALVDLAAAPTTSISFSIEMLSMTNTP